MYCVNNTNYATRMRELRSLHFKKLKAYAEVDHYEDIGVDLVAIDFNVTKELAQELKDSVLAFRYSRFEFEACWQTHQFGRLVVSSGSLRRIIDFLSFV